MKCLVLEAPNRPFQLRELPIPQPGPGQVLVKIAAIGVNPLDHKIWAGAAPHAKHPLPAVLGIDMAGLVAAVGPGVDGFSVDDRVYGMTGGIGGHQGSLAEYAAVDARLLAPAPRSLSFKQAAALPLAFITAWEGLVDRAQVASAMTVLVQGGAGGVGSLAIQIARSFGAHVYATGNHRSLPKIEQLGAIAIDYNTPAAEDHARAYTNGHGFDIVFDTAGGKSLDAAFALVARQGHVVSALGWGTHSLAPLSFKSASYSGIFTLLPLLTGEGRDHYGAVLRKATQLANGGALTPLIDERNFALEHADHALALVGKGENSGKVVIEVSHGA
jgi:NADPH:quinone reductase-like Zn-dependent oxidoreductase